LALPVVTTSAKPRPRWNETIAARSTSANRGLHKASSKRLVTAVGCIERTLDINAIPYSLPWYLPAIEETLEVLGEDFWPEGLEANWPNVATLMRYANV